MTTNTHPETVSAIVAMNARYEQSWLDYNTVEKAVDDEERGSTAYNRFSHAHTYLAREQAALQTAIIRQTPTTITEALILLSHLNAGIDCYEGLDDIEKNGVDEASGTVLEFFATEFAAHAPTGEIFTQHVEWARNRRLACLGQSEA